MTDKTAEAVDDLDYLRSAIEGRSARVGVIGLGYVGLSLGVRLAKAGWDVLGVDVSRERVVATRSALMFAGDTGPSPPIPASIAGVAASDIFSAGEAGMSVATVREIGGDGGSVDVWIICVPTPAECRGDAKANSARTPDYRAVNEAVSLIADAASKRAKPLLVVVESTVGPGCTRGLVGDALRRMLPCGVVAAYSPERIDPGSSVDITTVPKLVGGTTRTGGTLAAAVYRTVFADVVVADRAEDAEAAKLLENTYRAVNIAMANELADGLAAMGIDYAVASRLAATKPFGYSRFTSGLGPGGHCIPSDPWFLTEVAGAAGETLSLVESALIANDNRVSHVLGTGLVKWLGCPGAREPGQRRIVQSVGVYGIAYKRGVDDVRDSAGVRLANALVQLGYDVVPFDDVVTSAVFLSGGEKLESCERSVLRPTVASLRRCDSLLCVHGTDGIPSCVLDESTGTRVHDLTSNPPIRRLTNWLLRHWTWRVGRTDAAFVRG